MVSTEPGSAHIRFCSPFPRLCWRSCFFSGTFRIGGLFPSFAGPIIVVGWKSRHLFNSFRDIPIGSHSDRTPTARKSRLIDPCSRLIKYLESKNDVLLLTTSSRFREHTWDIPKTSQIALRIRDHLKQERKRVTLLDVAKLRIHICEGNISGERGNTCGVSGAKLRDKGKNPTGQHRCWASINNKDDQLYKISRELFRSQAVVFFVSVRWGQTNSVYQRLFERLSWIENRVTSLGEAPIRQLKKLDAGIVLFGHNWNDAQVLKTQKQNFKWFGWKTPAALSFNWQYTRDAEEESPESYLRAIDEFGALLQIRLPR